jgi:hypothetical protein
MAFLAAEAFDFSNSDASRTSSNLNGLMMAVMSFMVAPREDS